MFFPMLLGGIVAGGIGFFAAEINVFYPRADTGAESKINADLADLDARVTTLEQASPVAPLAPDTTATDTAITGLTTSLAALSRRVEENTNRPVASWDDAPQVNTLAFEAELATLKSSIETQRDEIQNLLDNALSVEKATAQVALAATAQSAVARIVAAITTGQPFAAEMTQLQANGIQDIPAGLAEAAETGVATSANLQDRFPDLARAALAASPADAGGGIGSFLKSQFRARSVTPREGNDPDAILSRAEAAVRDGRLADALTEVETLPEDAKSAMSGWIADTQARQAAQDAVDTLSQRLTAK
jgi:hypothetical protein